MKKFPNIPNKDLVYFGYRAEPYFVSSVIAGGLSNRANLKKKFGLTKPINTLLVNYELFTIQSTANAFAKELNKKLKLSRKRYIEKIVKECFKSGNLLIQSSKNIHRQTAKKNFSIDETFKLLKKYHKEAYAYCIYYILAWFEKTERELAETIARKYTNDEQEYLQLLDVIVSPSRLTASEREQDDFLRLCATQGGKNYTYVQKRAETHAKKYGWLSIRYFIGDPWTKKEVLLRLAAAEKVQALAVLKARLNHRKNLDLHLRSWLRKMSLGDRQQVSQIRDVIFLRTQRADFFHESSFYIQPLVIEAARGLNVKYADLLKFSLSEVIDSLHGRLNIDIHLAARKKCMVTYHNSSSLCLEGEAAEAYVQKRPVLQLVTKHTTVLQGKIAFPGIVKGKAKVVMGNEDIPNVKKGDILVTTMTTPNLTAAMESAAAFVTNEGGILCHAAIVSREMKKPCIIGTKIATKVFKDGDLIEVDANKGIVRKLSK